VNYSSLIRGPLAAGFAALFAAILGCGGSSGNGGFGDIPPQDAGVMSNDDAPSGSDSSIPGRGHTGTDANEPEVSTPETSTPDSSKPDTGVDSGMVSMDSDGFGQSRIACINTINALRAMQSLAPYTLIDNTTIDTCIDEQATNDESMNSAHYSFINDTYPACGYPPFNAQDECEGYGNQPGAPGSGAHGTNGTGIIGCLYDMWAEQYNSNCLGCVGCTAFGGACTGCDYYGMMGPECGHYVNMSASYFSMAACGFATGGGTWSAQNFE
jgi:hypothetical protein